MLLNRILRLDKIAAVVARRLSFRTTIRLVELLLREQGIGAGENVATSGERRVFDLVASDEPVLFDVGAHKGAYSRSFLQRFPRGRAYLFEPSGVHMALAKAALSGNAKFFDVGLAERDKVAVLYKSAEVSSLASLTKRDLEWRNIKMDVTEQVRCRALDEIVAEENIECIDLLKIDVEGHELDVLKGASDTLARRKVRLVQFEFGGCNIDTRTPLRDYFRLFEAVNYRIHLIRPHGAPVSLGHYREVYEQYTTTNFLAVRGDERA